MDSVNPVADADVVNTGLKERYNHSKESKMVSMEGKIHSEFKIHSILTVRMNTLQILNVLQSDPFTKSVFTSVVPSDRLPDTVLEKPRGFIVNVDTSDGPGSHWVAIYLTADGKGEFMDSYGQNLATTARTLKHFWKIIAVLLFIIS